MKKSFLAAVFALVLGAGHAHGGSYGGGGGGIDTGPVPDCVIGSHVQLQDGTCEPNSGPGGDVSTDSIWTSPGQIAVGTGVGTAGVLAAGAAGYVPTSNGPGVPWAWAPPTGGGETNTASNLGGGLDNYDSKNVADLRFNTFLAADFNLVSNVLSIDVAKWALQSQLHAESHTIASHDTTATGAELETRDAGWLRCD
jgi:hypothetical protein